MTNPDLKAIVRHMDQQALGVSAFVMRPHSPVADKAKFAAFAGDWSPEILKNILDSATDQSVYRGSVKSGSDDLVSDICRLAKKMATGQGFPKELRGITKRYPGALALNDVSFDLGVRVARRRGDHPRDVGPRGGEPEPRARQWHRGYLSGTQPGRYPVGG